MSCYVATADLEYVLIVPQSPKLWDCWDSGMCHRDLKSLVGLIC